MLFLVSTTGCGVSTSRIEKRHWDLNDSIRQTSTEQLLLNIVRLRYDEMPYFLQVSGVTTQFSTQQGASASGSFTQGAPGVLGIGASVGYSETPTVTWSLPDSREYLGRLMAPMSADQLTVLAQAGWDPQRVLRVGVKKINRLRSLDCTMGKGIDKPPTYDAFLEVLRLVNDLRREDLVDFAYGAKSSNAAGKIPIERMDPTAIPDALPLGVQFLTRDNPNVFEVLKLTKPLFLRFSKASDADPRAKRVRELLNLAPDKYSFGIVDTVTSGREQLLSESGKPTQVFEPDTHLAEILLNNRSMMEVLYFASTYVQVPQEHVDRGYLGERDSLDADWLHINVSGGEPDRVWLKVKYHGYWFYIAANDIKSRESFTLLDAMFNSVVGNVPGGKPLLTLPVN